MPQETWYVLEDGSNADPCEVAPDKKGVLRHKDGQAVAMHATLGIPISRGVDPDKEQRKNAKAKPKVEPEPELEPPKSILFEQPAVIKPSKRYKNREVKSE